MQTSPPLIFFVCAANLCRSPLAAALFQHRIDAAGLGSMVRTASAGVAADEGAARCEWSLVKSRAPSGRRSDDSADRGIEDSGGARPVTAEVLADAALVLAADRRVVSVLIRRAPRLRDRVFTIKEAAALGQLAVNSAAGAPGALGLLLDGGEPAARLSPGYGLGWLIAEMDGVRGWLPIDGGTKPNRFSRTRSWSKVMDVPDVHMADARTRHSTMFAELAPAIENLVDAVAATLPRAEIGV